jgi:hypothetical protein
VSDTLVNYYGSRNGFRLISLPVEATIPPVQHAVANDNGNGDATPNGGSAQRISREELYEDLAQASRLTPVYAVMVALSTVVAAVGLIRGDVAVIIGAMVIAPLIGPNVALSLACTLGDPDLAKRSLRAIGVGVTISRSGDCDPKQGGLGRRHPRSRGRGCRLAGLHERRSRRGRRRHDGGGTSFFAGGWRPACRGGILDGGGGVDVGADQRGVRQPGRGRDVPSPEGEAPNMAGAERATHATRIAVATWIIMLLVLLGLMRLGMCERFTLVGASEESGWALTVRLPRGSVE